MVVCSKLYLQPAPSREGRARRDPTIVDRAGFIALGPKYLTPPDHKKRADTVRPSPDYRLLVSGYVCLARK